jgi:predicted HTH domain antitoxin
MTYEEKPWQKARNGLPPEAASHNLILLEELKELGDIKVKELLENSTNIELIILLFVNEKVTLGQASKLAKMSQFKFQQLLASRQIPLHYDIAELEADVKTLQKMGRL